ncbi:MAG: hypothetical protein QNI88_14055 [Desulfobacterales bacterium]|nr:hypothetical protein [Desulfobacterales bacterium]
MDLSNLNLGELRQRLDAIDKNSAPHEALELSNEIGRRTADQSGEPEEESIRKAAVKAVQRSPWFVLVGILVFGIASHFHPPDDTLVLATVIAGISSGLGLIRMWETQKKDFLYLAGILTAIISHFIETAPIPMIQYTALFVSISATVIFVRRDRIRKLIEVNDPRQINAGRKQSGQETTGSDLHI